MRTLFDDLIEVRAPAAARDAERDAPVTKRLPADYYEHMTRTMLASFGVRVRKWRSSTSGVAWQLTDAQGHVTRLIESPRPRGPMSAAVFLHEIGHHAIGFDRYKLRCVEEYHAWMYSLEQMRRWAIPVTERVEHRVYDCLHYALAKAKKRGMRTVPPELMPYTRYRRVR